MSSVDVPSTSWSPKQWEAHFALARKGKLRQMLNKVQQTMYDKVFSGDYREIGWLASRKSGKSMTDMVIAYAWALSKPNQTIRVVAPEQKHCREIFLPICDELKAFIPSDVSPRLYKSTLNLDFPNGSKIKLGGMAKDVVDGNRGPMAHLIIFDEIAFAEENGFEYALNSVFLPQLTLTDGPRVYTTTMPQVVTHPFITDKVPDLSAKGAFVKTTIYDNPMLTPERIERIISDYPGGVESNDFKREQLSELVPDDSIRVCPEFNDSFVVSEGPDKPQDVIRHTYTSADLGVVDYSGILSGVYDHTEGIFHVDNEKWFNGEVAGFGIEYISKEINDSRAIVESRYTSSNHLTLVDCLDSLVRNELRSKYDMDITASSRGKLEGSIGLLRDCVASGRVTVHERCTNLIRQLKEGTWTENKKELARSKVLGHLDLVMALAYMLKRVDWNYRPDQRSGLKLGKTYRNGKRR